MGSTIRFGRRGVLKGAAATAALMAAARASFPSGAFAQGSGARDQQGDSGLHRAHRCRAADHGQGKEDLRQVRHHRRQRRQAGVVGHDARQHGAGFGGGRHRRRPHPDAVSLPDLARHRDGGEQADADVYPGAAQLPRARAISVANEFKSTGAKVDASPLKEAFAKKKAAGQEVKCAMTFPGGTHDMWIRYWLAAGGIDPDKDVSDHRRAAAADGGQHEGRQHGRPSASASRGTTSSCTRTSATPPAPPARSGRTIPRSRSACAPTGSTRIPRPPWPC